MSSLLKDHRKNRKVFIILGSLLTVLGILLLVAGIYVAVFNQSADPQGYHASNVYEIRTSAYAFNMEIGSLRLVTPYARLSSLIFGIENTVQARWIVVPQDPSKELFAGLARATEGKQYVNRMQTEGPPFWNWHGPFNPQINITTTAVSNQVDKGPSAPVAAEPFWLVSTHGKNSQSINYSPVWESQSDNKYLVIMNLDGSRDVKANIQLAFRIPIFASLPYWLIPTGIVFSLAGVLFIKRKKA